jgi:integrase
MRGPVNSLWILSAATAALHWASTPVQTFDPGATHSGLVTPCLGTTTACGGAGPTYRLESGTRDALFAWTDAWTDGDTVPKRTNTPLAWCVQRTKGGATFWIGRWRDPVTGRPREVVLDSHGITNAAARKRWREAKSEELMSARRAQRLNMQVGRVALAEAVASYLADCRGRKLRKSTLTDYTEAVEDIRDRLLERGLRFVQEVSPADLMAYRASVLKAPTSNRTKRNHLGYVRTALQWLRRQRFLPLIDSDAIDDACEGLEVEDVAIRCLRADEVAKLLTQALGREPIAAAFFVTVLLTGMRLNEAEALEWDELDLEAAPGGEIRLGVRTKTKKRRAIDLSVCPTVRELLRALPKRGRYVFGGEKPVTRQVAKRWKNEMQVLNKPWSWKCLRSTCGTWLTCAPGIFGAASVYRSARQLGHTVRVAERCYLDVLRGLPAEARTLESAMNLEDRFAVVLTRVRGSL